MRSALLIAAETEKERHLLDEQLPIVLNRHESRDGSDDSVNEPSDGAPTEYSLDQTIREVTEGREVSLRQAAHALQALAAGNGERREELVTKVLASIGSNLSYAYTWSYHESGISESLVKIVDLVPNHDVWPIFDTFVRDINRDSPWTFAISSNLLDLAFARAKASGLDELLEGLAIQLDMHIRWSFGKVEQIEAKIPKLPKADDTVTWKSIVHRLLPILLESQSADVLAAALHGLHTLVALDQSLIASFFATLNSTWTKYWLLSAAESWSALYPEAMKSVRQKIEQLAKEGRLEHRLQAWIVHCKHSDTLGIERMPFPVPSVAAGAESITKGNRGIIYTPPTHFGHAQFIDRHAGAISKLRRLAHCGFNFSSLESQIAETLSEITNGEQPERRGPRRRQDIFCTTLDEEEAVGKAINSVLSTEWFDQPDAVMLAEGYLCNEDAWLQRRPPLAGDAKIEWPFKNEYGGDSEDDRNIRSRLRNLLIDEGHLEGWRTFAGRIIVCTWKMDYLMHVWWEEMNYSLLLSAVKVPTCPTGRTFVWWLGDFFEPSTDGNRFVSGFFVGGMQRLSCCNLEIQPSKAWQSVLGWEPDSDDPLTWRQDGEIIARYERFHGPLRDNPHAPRSRQPIVERWVVSDAGFEKIESIIGRVLVRENYETHDFSEDLKRANE